MIKGLLLDIDDTIYSYNEAYNYALTVFYPYGAKLLGISEQNFIEAMNYGTQKNKQILKNCAANHHRGLYIQHALEYLNKNTFEHTIQLYNCIWNNFLNKMKLYPGVEEIFQEAQAKGIKIGFCTNMTMLIQHQKVQKLGVGKYVNFLVTSEEAGCEKPDSRIYQYALTKFQLPPQEVLMAGDSLKNDVIGPQKAGLQAAWYTADATNPDLYTGNKYNNYTDGKFLSFLNI